jgi:4-hydroxybenzoate polyprenyltransferase
VCYDGATLHTTVRRSFLREAMHERIASPRAVSADPSGSLWNKILGAFHLIQPRETVFLQALPAALFMRVGSPAGDFRRLLVLFFAVIAIYGAIGALNDYCDYSLDKTAKPRKPLIRGLVSKQFALWQALILAITGMAMSFALNWLTACFSALILALGVWYDVHAKRSLFSWVPYAVGIPTLPLWGFAAAGRFERVLLLAYPLGALLSVALNISNTLPDREGDAAFGLRALTHRLKLKYAVLLAWSLFAAAILGFAATAPLVGNRWTILAPGLLAGVVLLLIMIADYAIFRSRESLQRNWLTGGALAVVIGLAWVASLPHQ